jgi:PPK2 family polyphosphate:nucleotide phosphotransferase
MDYREHLIVEPGHKVRLKDIDPGYRGKDESHEKAEPAIERYLAEMSALQALLYAERKHALLIVLQGIDAAGKDGVCWHVVKGMNPQGCSVTGFKQPSEEERAHDFLWRVHSRTPGVGHVAVFNRSHYEDVLVVRVHKLVPKEVWEKRYDLINEFERLLVLNNTRIIKFFLYISKDEQLERFKQRLDDPARRWKISDADYKERDFWDDYVSAYEDMLSKCSTKDVPWYIIPSNHKWFRNLAISQIICATLKDIGMKMPQPSVDIAAVRQMYHQAATQQAKGR